MSDRYSHKDKSIMAYIRINKRTPKLKFGYKMLTSWWYYLRLFLLLSFTNLFLYGISECWIRHIKTSYFYHLKHYHIACQEGFNGSFADYFEHLFLESSFIDALIYALCSTILIFLFIEISIIAISLFNRINRFFTWYKIENKSYL